MDVHHFFESINRRILKRKLKEVIRDKRFYRLLCILIEHDKIALVAKILTDAGVEIDAEQTKTLVGCIAFDDISGALEILQEIGITGAMFDELKEIIEEMRKGVPLGYFTSQWFGNFYLKALDHYIKEELHAEHYMRYMDDMVILGKSKKKLHKIHAAIETYLNDNLDLEIKGDWQVFRFEYPVFDKGGNPVLDKDGKQVTKGRTGLMYCADCGAKMYVHRTSNGKRIAQYTCSAYTKVPCGTLCKTQHRINESVVLELIGDTLRAIFEYAKYDRSEFIDTITMAQSTQEDAEVKKVRARIAVAGNRCEELEKLICRIYEDNILGKLPDSRYEVLDKQYAREKAELDAEIKELEAKLTEYEKSRNSAGKFIALIDKYEKFEELTPAMVNEFVDKVLVHERDRKGSIQTTQEIEIYFNFVGRYVPPAMMTEPTAEEQAEIDRINRIKDRRHQQYLRRKESGWQRKYEERVKNEKRAKMQAMKEEIRRQDRENGVYATAGSLALEPTIGMPE